MSDRRAGEATAPCSVELAGAPGTAAVSVAIDRRAWCRVELGGDGVEVFARDTVQKSVAGNVAELEASGGAASMLVVTRTLRALGLDSGVRVETRSRLPEGSGLGESSALAVAVAGAAHEALGRPVDLDTLADFLGSSTDRDTDLSLEASGLAAALLGGTVLAHRHENRLRAEPLTVDPARVEESLLLVDSGSTRTPGATGPGGDRGGDAEEMPGIGAALVAGRIEEVVGLMEEQWAARKEGLPALSTAEIDRVVDLARAASAAAWACGPGPGGLVALWAPPGRRGAGRREAVEAALSAAGLRVFPARVDLLGLDGV